MRRAAAEAAPAGAVLMTPKKNSTTEVQTRGKPWAVHSAPSRNKTDAIFTRDELAMKFITVETTDIR